MNINETEVLKVLNDDSMTAEDRALAISNLYPEWDVDTEGFAHTIDSQTGWCAFDTEGQTVEDKICFAYINGTWVVLHGKDCEPYNYID